MRWAMLVPIVLGFESVGAMAQPGQMQFDCDAPPGHYSKMDVLQAPGQRTVSGTLQADMLYRERKWEPTAQARLAAADGSSWAGVKLHASAPAQRVVRDGGSVDVLIAYRPGKSPIVEERIGSIPLGQSIAYTIVMDDEHVRVRVGETERAVKLELSDTRKMELGCSTGDFKFADTQSK